MWCKLFNIAWTATWQILFTHGAEWQKRNVVPFIHVLDSPQFPISACCRQKYYSEIPYFHRGCISSIFLFLYALIKIFTYQGTEGVYCTLVCNSVAWHTTWHTIKHPECAIFPFCPLILRCPPPVVNAVFHSIPNVKLLLLHTVEWTSSLIPFWVHAFHLFWLHYCFRNPKSCMKRIRKMEPHQIN